MNNDARSRKWQLTINNPVEHGFTHESLRVILGQLKTLIYWCMSDEVGENGTYHTHVYIALNNAIRFSTLKSKFNGAHFEIARGTSQQNKDYVFKEGKWEKDKKSETNLKDTHEEYGELPIENQGARNDLAVLYDMLKQGMRNDEIISECPQYLFNIDKIERARQTIKEAEYRKVFRKLDVTYIFGKTGSGKTRGIMEEYGYENVYRVTDYDHPFDGYKGQDVVVFEEFRSSLKIQDMLNFLDGYPLELPCRYSNKIACYTKVYLVTNIALNEQYRSVQGEYKETWNALLRRITKIKEYSTSGIVEYSSYDEYNNHFERDNVISLFEKK